MSYSAPYYAVPFTVLLVVFSLTTPIIADVDLVGKRIEAKWETQGTGIVSGIIRGTLSRYLDKKPQCSLTVEKLESMISNLQVAQPEHAIELMQKQLTKDPNNSIHMTYWNSPLQIVFEGMRVLNAIDLADDKRMVNMFTGAETIEVDAIVGQASILPGRSNRPLIGGRGIAHLPNLDRSVTDSFRKTTKKQVNGQTRLSITYGDTAIFEVDGTTGFIHNASYSGVDGHGALRLWQFFPIPTQEGFELPTVRIEAHLDLPDRIRRLQVLYVNKARINVPIPAEAWKISVPRGITVVDFRRRPNDPPRTLTQHTVPDILEFVDSPTFDRVRKKEQASVPPALKRDHFIRPRASIIMLVISCPLVLLWVYRRLIGHAS